MNLQQSEFRDQFTYQTPILPESVDNATAFFYALNQLMRSTPSEISGTLTSDEPGFAMWILDRVGFRLRDIVITIVGCIRRAGVAAPSTWKG
jgi:hypothetical protein